MMALILPCRDVVEAASSDGIAAEPWWRRPLFAVHLAGCDFCSRFVRQMGLIRRVLSEQLSRPKSEDSAALREAVLRRLRRRP
jgi:hypothetical protein